MSLFVRRGAPPLRYYQQAAVDAVAKSLQTNRSTLVVMATGTGKTRVFSALAEQWPGRVLVLAHREELVAQARAALEVATGEAVGTEKAEQRSWRERIVVGSVQTVSRPRRLEHMRDGGWGLVVVDEAHHAIATSYRTILDAMPEAKLVGVTATPDRGDERALGQLFDDVAFEFGISEGIRAGYLVPIRGRTVEVETLDLRAVGEVAGDLHRAQLDSAILKATAGIVDQTLKLFPGSRGPVFLPGKASAMMAADLFNQFEPGSAVVVTDDTEPEERAQSMADVKACRVRFLCNCMVATEGFDWPEASHCFIARPTKSRGLYAQMVGRATRVLPGVVDHVDGEAGATDRRAAVASSAKPHCTVVDFTGKMGMHSLASVADVLGGKADPEVLERAKRKLAGKPDTDPMQALDEAEDEVALARQALAKVAVKSQSKQREFNPFQALGIESFEYADRSVTMRYGFSPASDKQIAALQKFGVPEGALRDLSKRGAVALMDELIQRSRRGLCSLKQANVLRQYGVDPGKVTRNAARDAFDYMASVGWRRANVDRDKLRALAYRERVPGED